MSPFGWRFRSESTSMERLDGETIIIDFDSGQFYSFQRSAADIAWLIEHRVPRARWSACLGAAFADFSGDAELNAEIDAFVSRLEEAGLITLLDEMDAGEDVVLPSDYAREQWQPPQVSVNDSLSDLLAIDPIHDVSDDGWPQTPDR